MGSRAPANNGVHTVKRTPNAGIHSERREDFEATRKVVAHDPTALLWMERNKGIWFPAKKILKR